MYLYIRQGVGGQIVLSKVSQKNIQVFLHLGCHLTALVRIMAVLFKVNYYKGEPI